MGDEITAARGRLAIVAIVRKISTVPGGRVLHLEVPGLPQFSWPVEFSDTERVERHSGPGLAVSADWDRPWSTR